MVNSQQLSFKIQIHSQSSQTYMTETIIRFGLISLKVMEPKNLKAHTLRLYLARLLLTFTIQFLKLILKADTLVEISLFMKKSEVKT